MSLCPVPIRLKFSNRSISHTALRLQNKHLLNSVYSQFLQENSHTLIVTCLRLLYTSCHRFSKLKSQKSYPDPSDPQPSKLSRPQLNPHNSCSKDSFLAMGINKLSLCSTRPVNSDSRHCKIRQLQKLIYMERS